jgi:hypothetical protein
MSWFKRTPQVKAPPKQVGYRSSPASERLFNEIKEQHRIKDNEGIVDKKYTSEHKL